MWIGAAIGLLQLLVLPGRLAVRLLGLDEDGRIQTWVLSFGLSLLASHVLVAGLVLAGGFHREVLWAVVLAELAAAAVLFRRALPSPPRLSDRLARYLAEPISPLPHLVPALATLAILGWLASRVPSACADGFALWDVVQSWSRWALDWESGHGPAFTHGYPQLVPTSWALLFVLQGSTLPFAAHGLMALFPLATVAILFDLGLRRRDPTFHAAAVVMGLLFGLVHRRWLDSGNVDMPVGFFALLAVYPLLAVPPGVATRGEPARLAVAALAAAAAALTKQTALFVVAVLPLLVWLRSAHRSPRARILASGAVGAGALALVAPWLAWVQLQYQRGLDAEWQSRVALAAAAAGGPVGAIRRLADDLTAPGLAVLAGCLLASLRHRELRWITLVVVLPFVALWATRAGYDARNLALVEAHLSISAAAGLAVLWEAGARLPRGRRRLAAALAWAVAALPLAAVVLDTDETALDERHEAQWIERGDAEFNRQLLRYARNVGLDGKILSDDRFLLLHPELRDAFFMDRDARGVGFDPFLLDASGFEGVVSDPANRIRYLLVSRSHRPGFTEWLERGVREGRLVVLFRGQRNRYFIAVRSPDARRDEGA